jgi:hypothetical protein
MQSQHMGWSWNSKSCPQSSTSWQLSMTTCNTPISS